MTVESRTTALSQRFWEGVAERRFLLQYDPAADRYQFFPRPLSLWDIDAELEWREAAGTGRLVAHTLCHKGAPGYEDQVPYRLAIVELDEGPRIFARLHMPEGREPAVGDAMRIRWDQGPDGRILYGFEPA